MIVYSDSDIWLSYFQGIKFQNIVIRDRYILISYNYKLP